MALARLDRHDLLALSSGSAQRWRKLTSRCLFRRIAHPSPPIAHHQHLPRVHPHHKLKMSTHTYDPTRMNVFSGPNSLIDYFNPDKNAPLPLVELPPQLNPYYDDGVRIYAKMLTALPATNVKSLPGKCAGSRFPFPTCPQSWVIAVEEIDIAVQTSSWFPTAVASGDSSTVTDVNEGRKDAAGDRIYMLRQRTRGSSQRP